MRLKKIKSIMAVIVMMSILSTATFADTSIQNFIKQKDYASGAFKDVSSTAWYVNDVQTVYELGLMGGKGASQFDPNGNLLIAEAIAMVARVHHVYYGGDGTIPPSGTNWYDGAVSYCIEKGIIKKGDFTSYTSKITRAQMAYLFASVLPEGEYSKINDISKLPDVSASTLYSNFIFRLYNAGIVGGSDAKGTFKPDSNIIRAEAAAIIKRVVQPEVRRAITLSSEETVQVADKEVTLTEKEALEKNFNFNGKYYPFGYWMGHSEIEAKNNFLDLYRNAHKPVSSMAKDIYVGIGQVDLMNSAWHDYYIFGVQQDERIYEAITKDILAKYPILTTGTTEQKVQRQLEQIREYAKWLAKNTNYGDENGLQNLVVRTSTLITMDKELSALANKFYTSQTSTQTYYNAVKSYQNAYYNGMGKSFQASKGMIYEGVCEGYAQLTEDVLRQMGIETVYVGSSVHAWNVVMFANGMTAHLDTTDVSVSGTVHFFHLPLTVYSESYDRHWSSIIKERLTNSINTIKSVRLMAAMNYDLVDSTNGYPFDKIPEGDVIAIFGTIEKAKEYIATLKNLK